MIHSDIMPGDRVRVTGIMDDPDPLPIGATGTVRHVNAYGGEVIQIEVDWDVQRSLMLLPVDPFEIIERKIGTES